VHPAVERLASYRAALERGWSPNTMNLTAGQAEAKRIDTDPAGFLAAQDERGYATTALRLLLPEARALSLPYVELTTDLNNTASQKVITTNGGVLIERFERPAAYGSDSAAFRWRIRLHNHPAVGRVGGSVSGGLRFAECPVEGGSAEAEVPGDGGDGFAASAAGDGDGKGVGVQS